MSDLTLDTLLNNPKDEVVIVGTNALIPHLEKSSKYLQNLLGSEDDLKVEIYYESENENFNQSILLSVASSNKPTPSFKVLSVHQDRIRGSSDIGGLEQEILDNTGDEIMINPIKERLKIKQLHLKSPMDIIKSDSKIFYSPITHRVRGLKDYIEADPDGKLYEELSEYITLLQEGSEKVGVFLSKPGDELIWVYDKGGIARGIFPRNAFYTTEYARYSVWGLVFNHKGELLLQKRSATAKDNRGMWDKSVGGHVDLEDATTGLTAKRELIEEMYLPKAEFTKHMKADIGDIVDFGDWLPRKRPERLFKESFNALSADDWIMFRALHEKTELPLTIERMSERLWYDDGQQEPRIRRTIFMSDVYFFMSPKAKNLDGLISELAASDDAAATAYRFVSISDLAREVADAEVNNLHTPEYTDDLRYLITMHRDLLDSIAEFSNYIGEE
jgi:hypothetical protein